MARRRVYAELAPDEYGNLPDIRFLPHLFKHKGASTPFACLCAQLRAARPAPSPASPACDAGRRGLLTHSSRRRRLRPTETPWKAIGLAVALLCIGTLFLSLGVLALQGNLHVDDKGTPRELVRGRRRAKHASRLVA